ncbi:MAG: hypothetical protein HQL82_10810 [Magnetococcales bacterium]|nr:hypothetical protein [Magnetococcales bacterium]
MQADSKHQVRQFRQILLWPLQLLPLPETEPRRHWQMLEAMGDDSAWRRVVKGIGTAEEESQEIRYKEFLVFLPHVRRFLHGEARGSWIHTHDDPPGDSAIRLFRRQDVTALRVVPRAGAAPLLLDVESIELYFFDDIDLAFLKVEISGRDLSLSLARELLYRLGRAYPTGWNEDGLGIHNVVLAEWLGPSGESLVTSDSNDRARFLAFSCRHRSPGTSAHWTFLLHPLLPAASETPGPLRFHQVENHHMPLMAYLALDNPRGLTRDHWLRLGMADSLHPDEPIPRNDPELTGFEGRYFLDRYWSDTDDGPNCRFICRGRVFLLVGDAEEGYFVNSGRGMLVQFRHQYFLAFLIVHLYRAALLVFSDRLVDAVHDLDMRQGRSVRTFRHRIHLTFEAFLRFTHRYWFHEISERTDIQSVFQLAGRNLANERLYREIKEELHDMSQYLDGDMQRRQSKTVTQLTVVTAFSLIGTVATSFLGMNIISEADAPLLTRWGYFFLTFLVTAVIMLLTLMQSQWLWDLLDLLSDARKPLRTRLGLILQFLRTSSSDRPPR